jgi:hypothetical protein
MCQWSMGYERKSLKNVWPKHSKYAVRLTRLSKNIRSPRGARLSVSRLFTTACCFCTCGTPQKEMLREQRRFRFITPWHSTIVVTNTSCHTISIAWICMPPCHKQSSMIASVDTLHDVLPLRENGVLDWWTRRSEILLHKQDSKTK